MKSLIHPITGFPVDRSKKDAKADDKYIANNATMLNNSSFPTNYSDLIAY